MDPGGEQKPSGPPDCYFWSAQPAGASLPFGPALVGGQLTPRTLLAGTERAWEHVAGGLFVSPACPAFL